MTKTKISPAATAIANRAAQSEAFWKNFDIHQTHFSAEKQGIAYVLRRFSLSVGASVVCEWSGMGRQVDA